MKVYYTYYSYEEWGRGYIGSKPSGCECNPEEDFYMGSFKDKTFKPSKKIILGVYSTSKECLEAEIKLHEFFEVDINPHFVNLARQTSTGFVSLVKTKEHREKIGESLRGKSKSQESIFKRQKSRQYATGDKHHMSGKTHSEETRRKIKEKRAEQTNISGGCSYPWWVNSQGVRTRSVDSPGPEWQRGMKWIGG